MTLYQIIGAGVIVLISWATLSIGIVCLAKRIDK